MSLVPHYIKWLSYRRLTAFMLLATSVLMAFPVALPVGTRNPDSAAEGKDLSEPFPCQSRACGCRSAKQCWKKCCCFTNAQKLAWAKAHRVQPPAFVAEAARQETAQEVVVARPTAEKAQACCAATGKCHAESACEKSSDPSTRKTRKSELKSNYVIGVQALQCQGIDQGVFGQLVSIEPPAVSVFVLDNFDQGEVVPPLRCAPLVPCDQEPPTPPPRQAV